ncbi:MAG: hypothetical protein JXQ91_07660 [Vannielia sp.]|uniref:hypothetical protein n=1 Tax=Vannielia sp. TaxID=2813045 RepID=UPI003B8EA9E6
MLRGVAVLHTVARYDKDVVTYYGDHPDFDETRPGEEAPEYEVILTADEAGVTTRAWRRLSA